MKNSILLGLALVLFSCQSSQEQDSTAADQVFQKNAETLKTYLEEFQNEAVDYSVFADDFLALPTMFGDMSDSVTKEQMMQYDSEIWALMDFEIISELDFLPGVNAETKKPDGSVRYYAEWQLTRATTDSTPEKSGTIRMYESYDFNDQGKIIYQQSYGDMSALWTYLMTDEAEMME